MRTGVSIIVQGRVQGVGFRFWVRQQAESLQLTGFARNQPDGSLYLEAYGAKSNLLQLVVSCRQGPSYAEVVDVKISWLASEGSYSHFTISS